MGFVVSGPSVQHAVPGGPVGPAYQVLFGSRTHWVPGEWLEVEGRG
jgi:hypothetical protein